MAIKNFIDGLSIGPAWGYLNLTVHPVISNTSRMSAYLTLDDALATGRFRIGEISLSGRVPELKVLNDLSQPVLLLDGEELVGAKQNRILNLTIMVPANTEMTIPVSCVEAGRWQHSSAAFAAADRTQFARGRAKKLTQVSDSLRMSGRRSGNQTDIWQEIAAKSSRMAIASSTAAMAAIYERNQARLNEFVRAMPRSDRQVGAVFSIDGKIVGVDIFDSPNSFAKTAPKLIRSYAVDALDSTVEAAGDTNGQVRIFLEHIAACDFSCFKAVGLGDDLRFNTPYLAGAALLVSGQVVHLVSFPVSVYGSHQQKQSGHRPMARARMRRTFH